MPRNIVNKKNQFRRKNGKGEKKNPQKLKTQQQESAAESVSPIDDVNNITLSESPVYLEGHAKKKHRKTEETIPKKKRKGGKKKTQKLEIQQQESAAESVSPIDDVNNIKRSESPVNLEGHAKKKHRKTEEPIPKKKRKGGKKKTQKLEIQQQQGSAAESVSPIDDVNNIKRSESPVNLEGHAKKKHRKTEEPIPKKKRKGGKKKTQKLEIQQQQGSAAESVSLIDEVKNMTLSESSVNLKGHAKKKHRKREELIPKKKRKGRKKKTKTLEIQQQGSTAESVSPFDDMARQEREITAQSEDCQTMYSRIVAKGQSNEADKSSIREETIGTSATLKTTKAKLLAGQKKRLQRMGHLNNEATKSDEISEATKMKFEKQTKNSCANPMEQASISGTREPNIRTKGHAQVHTYENGTNTEEGKICDPCAYSNATQEAVNYCVQCEDFLCDTCSSSHRRSKLSRAHQLLGNGEMPTEKVISSMPNAGICAKHNGEPLRFYCKKHREFVCSICVVIYHQRCQVELIEEIATGFDESEEYKKVVTKLRGSVFLLTEQVKLSSQNENIVKKSEVDLISKIRNFRSSVDVRFDAMERAAITKVREVCQKEIEILRNVSDTCVEKEREINEIDDNLKSLEEFQQKQPLVVATKHVLKRIENLDSMVEDLCKASPMKSYVFKQNIKLVEALHCCQSFGDIVAEIGSDVSASKKETTNDASEKFQQLDKGGAKVKKVKQKDTNTTENVRQIENDGSTAKHVRQIHTRSSTEERVQQLVNDGEKAERVRKIHTRGATSKKTRQMHILGVTAENVRQTDNNDATAEKVKRLDIGGAKVEKVDYLGDINVKCPTDANDCWITGCVKIDEDRLAVVDRNNHSVKVVDVNSAAIQSYAKLMYGPPWDITCIGGKELVVTCENTLLFLDTTTLNVKEIMNLDGCSRGIDESRAR